ncbi:MAG: hypothetical protein RLY83_766 [Actinomycetota bacterium]|jgi:hypothetical protein
MKKLFAVLAATMVLAGCSPVAKTVAPETVSYGLPMNCEIKALLDLDPKYAIVDQTAEGVDDSRDCVVGVPNSDVGVFFGYSVRTHDQWLVVTAKLVAEGYKKWNVGIPGVETWRKESGDAETGSNCSVSGYITGISFSVTEPWTKCDDKWNKELVGYLVEHAKQN